MTGMLDRTHDPMEPQPQYPTAEEIALAERLLRKIEERYLGTQHENGRGSQEPRPLPKAA
jgi:hypothetical protein